MEDISQKLLAQYRSLPIPGLNLAEPVVYPQYEGNSILNLPDTVCQALGAPALSGGPLAPEVLGSFSEEVERVVLVVMDALALHRLRRWLEAGIIPAWGRLAQEGRLAALTSITPSTTSAALTSLWTGRSAAEHGITGYEMWMKEYGVVANTITQAPMSFHGPSGSLRQAGFDPEQVLPFPTLGSHLQKDHIRSFALQHHSIAHSGLSKMYFKDVDVQSFSTATDLWVNARQLMEQRSSERMYVYIYWSEVDTFSHRYGPDDERCAEELASFGASLERLFLQRLSPQARRKTLLLLTADHGQVSTNPDPAYNLTRHPNLLRRLHILPTGEHRLAYFYIRPGQTEAVREYIERTWPNQFSFLDPAYAVGAGLFGPGKPHPRLLDRLGDLIVVAKDAAYFWWNEDENKLHGRHGSLHPDEMLVPLLAVRLDGSG